VKLLFDESLSPKLLELLGDLFPKSDSALNNGLARQGDTKIPDYATTHGFVLVTTDSDFEYSPVLSPLASRAKSYRGQRGFNRIPSLSLGQLVNINRGAVIARCTESNRRHV
jgi:hypothetical protein